MKILMLNPPRFNGMCVSREDRCESTIPNVTTPTGLIYLSTLLIEKGHSVEFLDANGYNLNLGDIRYIIENRKLDYIIFRATPETFYEDIKIADLAKKINDNVKIIMICWSLSTVSKDVLTKAKSVDYYIIDYYYERPILDILAEKKIDKIMGLSYRDNGTILANFHTNKTFNFDSIQIPAWYLIPDFGIYWVQVPSINPWAFVTSTKGCGMGCTFCTIHDIKPSFRDTKKVVDEIEYLHTKRGLCYISFSDATFNINSNRVFEICNEMISRNLNRRLKWFANIRANITIEEAEIMKESGCRGVSIGIESGSQKVLDLAAKKIKVSECQEAIKNLKRVGIKQYTSFIVGLPGDTPETVNQTKEFILKTRPTGFQINSLVPYPRSKVYMLAIQKMAMKELRFDDLLLYNTPVSLCDMNIEEINEFRRKIYRDIYLSPGWWLSNISEVMKNPEDIILGIDYSKKVFRRLIKGIDIEN